jgi:hypothetical protein
MREHQLRAILIAILIGPRVEPNAQHHEYIVKTARALADEILEQCPWEDDGDG